MNYSTALTKYLKFNRDVIENPKSHFGPNYEAVFNCWSFFDTLTKTQKSLLRLKYETRDESGYSSKVFDAFRHNANIYNPYSARMRVANLSQFVEDNMSFAMITYEIIGMDILLDQGHSLYFIPMLENL
jgi:hypothetical protein